MMLRVQLLVAALLALLALPAAGAQRTGPDSFLKHRADTVEELVRQVETDSVLRQRLAKHFRVSQAQLVAYLRDNLEVITFSESGWRPVYGVTSTGRIYRAKDYFHQGGKVFGLADGTPLLKYACGNPLVTELPAVAPPVVALPAPPVEAPVHAAQEYRVVMAPPQAPVLEVPPPYPFAVPQEYMLAVDPPHAPWFEVPSATLVERAAFPVPWPLGLLLMLPDGDGQPPEPIIPEPSNLALMLAGLSVLAGAAWWRRRAYQAA